MSYNEDGQTDRQTQTSTNLDERNENILRPFFQVKPRPENQTRYSHCDALPSPVPLIRLLCSQGTNASFLSVNTSYLRHPCILFEYILGPSLDLAPSTS